MLGLMIGFLIGFFVGAAVVFLIMAVALLTTCDNRKDWWDEE